MRVFIGLVIPDEVQTSLDQFCHQACVAGAHKPQDRHMTLFFLGQLTEEEVGSLIFGIDKRVTKSVISWKPNCIGLFPSEHNPKVWALQGETVRELEFMRQQMFSIPMIASSGLNKEGFRPHVSLSRSPKGCPSIDGVSLTIRFDRLGVFESESQQSEIRYRELAGWNLE